MGKSDKKRILLKIGSNVLTKETNHISKGKIEDIANQISVLQDQYEFVIVSSGAIAAAKQFVNLDGKEVTVKQALAAIGQPRLMRIYQDIFKDAGLFTSQCLLSYSDFEKEQSKENIVNTINVLVENNYIPIINENDTVATDEIKFGDNDKLGALTAALLNVDLFLIATNTNGIYTKESMAENEVSTIKSTSDISALKNEIEVSISTHGTGGMTTKIQAAEIAQNTNIETWIVNGLNDNFIIDAIKNKIDFTKITTK
ncbi:glutamate 5-kinase [Urechidicola croceus]|uniref:Glutamate 5-kinase n=1 Tax=Urechidicola croceus TaxID=1850246 RepID=A0A1D8P7A4_9FLAO|nr:glutamate 5-kinase [Urechidicola croceus]AOW20436.1 glutamate 5-kinase [Urechidicola croceus]